MGMRTSERENVYTGSDWPESVCQLFLPMPHMWGLDATHVQVLWHAQDRPWKTMQLTHAHNNPLPLQQG